MKNILKEPSQFLGNDIVDLKDPDCKNTLDNKRFCERVFTKEELISIQNSNQPLPTLWMHWAAKEASYKLIKREFSDTIFSHKKFVFDVHTNTIHYKNQTYSCEIIQNQDFVHVLCKKEKDTSSDYKVWIYTKEDIVHLSSQYFINNLSLENQSELVRATIRFGILKLYPNIKYDMIQIEKLKDANGKQIPPIMQIPSLNIQISISMSHHGRYFAGCLNLGMFNVDQF